MNASFVIVKNHTILYGVFSPPLSSGTKIGVCLLPNTCVALGTKVLSVLEIRNEGLLFSNFAEPLSLDDEFHMGWVILMLFIDTILYMSLYWFVHGYSPFAAVFTVVCV